MPRDGVAGSSSASSTDTTSRPASPADAGASLDLAARCDELVLAERVRLLYGRSGTVLAMLVGAGALLLVLLGERRSSPAALAWASAMAAITSLRALVARRYASRERAPAEAPRWARLYTYGSALSGVVWGIAGTIFYVPGSLLDQVLLILIITGLVGGALGSNLAYGQAAAVFSIPVGAPALFRLCWEGDRTHLSMAAMMLLFATAMNGVRRSGARAVNESIRLRFENEAFAAHHAHEVIEHRHAAQALRESEALFRDLAERATVGVYLIQDGVMAYVNPRMAEVFGYTPEELIGKMRYSDLTLPDDRELVAGNIRRRLQAEETSIQYEFRGVRKNGEVIWVEVYGTRTIHRGRTAIVGTLLDTTRRKTAEEEQARVEKLESLGILAGGIAHDFNNLLAAILADISLAREASGGDAYLRELLVEAEGAALRAKDLTLQLLTFSRGGEPVKKRLELGPVLRAAASFALRGSKVSCDYELSSDLWPVHVDEGQIGQVVQNLVLNAVQAMPDGGVVRISAENVREGAPEPAGAEAPRSVRIAVGDTGPGIRPEIARRIFDPYFTTKQGGTGLGLATAHSIVKRHGGSLRLDTTSPRGATFLVTLPAAPDGPDATAPARGAVVPGRGWIAVMDDDELVRNAVARMLRRLGYDVALASDGTELLALCAAARAEGRPIDAAIMDLTIPGGMGGKETMALLGEREPLVKAIVSSGYSKDPVMADYRKYGFSSVLAKPYQIEELAGTLARVLGG
jgi:two-component system, cell cycle sensor histidine kinase and response regulator CckA